MSITFARETYGSIIEDLIPILKEHWEEIAVYKDVPLDPEYDIYITLEAQNILAVYTIRQDAKLIGYSVYFIRRHGHYRGSLWAFNDIIFIRKAFRNAGTGSAFLGYIESDLRQQGVQVVSHSAKIEHPELARLLESRGHEKVETVYWKRL